MSLTGIKTLMKKNNTPENIPYHNGACFSPIVDTEVLNEKSGRLKWWYCDVCIGEEYFETDRYISKDYAISEMIGYLEGLEILIKKEIENLRQMLK